MDKARSKTGKIIGAIFSLLIINTLLLAGPAQGLVLTLDVDRTMARQGQSLTFTAEIEVEQGVAFDEVTFELSGREQISCTFDIQGNAISGCEDITITLQNSDFDFGYGYGYGANEIITYSLTLRTNTLSVGTYAPSFSVEIGGETITQQGTEITIRPRRVGGGTEEMCDAQWQCSAWSSCTNGVQTRSCSRVVGSCSLIGERPELTQSCSLPETSVSQISENPERNLPGNVNSATMAQTENTFSIYYFVVIFLLMNCIITTLNIIIKVMHNSRRRKPGIPARKK